MSQKDSVRTINEGIGGYQSRKKADEAIEQGIARLRGDGVVEYISHPDRALRDSAPDRAAVELKRVPQSARIKTRDMRPEDRAADCVGIARYPMPSGGHGLRFPALAKQGAGL